MTAVASSSEKFLNRCPSASGWIPVCYQQKSLHRSRLSMALDSIERTFPLLCWVEIYTEHGSPTNDICLNKACILHNCVNHGKSNRTGTAYHITLSLNEPMFIFPLPSLPSLPPCRPAPSSFLFQPFSFRPPLTLPQSSFNSSYGPLASHRPHPGSEQGEFATTARTSWPKELSRAGGDT